jgi:DNA-binding transcriptional ArsR family regulator
MAVKNTAIFRIEGKIAISSNRACILDALRDGLTYAAIADKLAIAIDTVSGHVQWLTKQKLVTTVRQANDGNRPIFQRLIASKAMYVVIDSKELARMGGQLGASYGSIGGKKASANRKLQIK